MLQKVGAVAYWLDLPSTCKIHPVIHVSQLKKHVPPNIQVSPDIAEATTDSSLAALPVAIIDRRSVRRGASTKTQVRVRWATLPPTLDSWEDLHDLRRRYPDAPI